MKKVIIAGAGGHCKVVLDILSESEEYEIVGLLSRDNEETTLGVPVIGNDSILERLRAKGVNYAFAAIGDNAIRRHVQQRMERLGFELISPISNRAIVSKFAHIGSGTVVMPGAVINADADIGSGCIINTNCSIDHDCKIGDYTHIAPGVAISGSVFVGTGSFIGSGARIIDHIAIGCKVIIGAGAAVIQDIESFSTAVGVPAKVIKGSKQNEQNINRSPCF